MKDSSSPTDKVRSCGENEIRVVKGDGKINDSSEESGVSEVEEDDIADVEYDAAALRDAFSDDSCWVREVGLLFS